MDILIYNELDTAQIPNFDKLYQYLLHDDFKSADVKKIQNNLYRAKLNRSDRLLFSIYHYQQKKYLLLLEYLKKHDYEGSRFLRGDRVLNEDDITVIQSSAEFDDVQDMVYVNPNHPQFVYLNKFISFDDVQQAVYQQRPPLVIVGSAGSGKTAILLEKMKKLEGQILYVTLSSFLVKNSRELYFSDDYFNEHQTLDFYSFAEFLESIAVPSQRPADLQVFKRWYQEVGISRLYSLHSLYEEFRGVLTGANTTEAYLSEAQYLALGIKQSIFNQQEKAEIYQIFTRYLSYLKAENYYDSNLLSHAYLTQVAQRYDYVVIDEVQDITAIQLYLVLSGLKKGGAFLLCGDANQIVHPNFFSWAKVKTLFHEHEDVHQGQEITHILHHNYRNAQRVTELSNRVLLLKHARFGSIDKESHYLVESNAEISGGVFFLQHQAQILQELDQKTAISTQFAVVVMHEDQKKMAQRLFKTPLIFSIQEAKGLEYQNIILYNFVTQATQHFNSICQGIQSADLQKDFAYARNKDKTDKSLEIYKFYINALYVGLTRAMCNLYWVEQEHQHQIFQLLGMQNAVEHLDLIQQDSSLQDWQREAKKLELQGKTEQAERIRKEILKEEVPTWQVLDRQQVKRLEQQALSAEKEDKKARLMLFEYAIVYQHWRYLFDLAEQGFKPAKAVLDKKSQYQKALSGVEQKYYLPYGVKTPTAVLQKIEKFGINFLNEFNQTPLMASVWRGNFELFAKLMQDGADLELYDNENRNILQIALLKASHSEKYCKQFLKPFYTLYPKQSLVLQLENRLFKIEPHQPEYILFHTMFAVYMDKVHDLLVKKNTLFKTAIFMQIFEHFSDDIWSAQRKKRSYLSALLSKNEVDSSNLYGKKLFQRVAHGEYSFNPKLLIKLGDQWHKIYDAMDVERIHYFEKLPAHSPSDLHEYFDAVYEKRLLPVLNLSRQA